MLYIIVPTFNRLEIFKKFIKQMEAQKNRNFRLVVVDHGKNRTNYRDPEVIVVESDVNGWSLAMNIGLQYLFNTMHVREDDHIMFLNDDVWIDEDFIDTAYKAIEQKPDACIGSVCYACGTDLTLHVNMKLHKMKAHFQYLNINRPLGSMEDTFYDSDVLKGRGTIYPVRVIQTIGLLNEKKLPMYRADHEMAYRAKKCGCEVCVYGKWHVGAALDSPHQVDGKLSFLQNYRNIFLHMISVQNIRDLWNFSWCCFEPFYASYYFLVNLMRSHYIFLRTYFKARRHDR